MAAFNYHVAGQIWANSGRVVGSKYTPSLKKPIFSGDKSFLAFFPVNQFAKYVELLCGRPSDSEPCDHC
jgi:hypothetical protein